MNLNRNRLDDSFNFIAIAIAALFAVGLSIEVSLGHALDRGSSQARLDEGEHAVRVAAANAEAKAAGDLKVAARDQ
jgi:hypothetical protein